MNFHKIKSHAKINLSLNVLGKLKSKMHKIESLVSFLNLSDEILIKKINNRNHKVKFVGKFSRKIPENNTITNLLYLLDDKKKLKNQKYLIKVKKNIPQKSGMGGGSMNASAIIRYLKSKNLIRLTNKETKTPVYNYKEHIRDKNNTKTIENVQIIFFFKKII